MVTNRTGQAPRRKAAVEALEPVKESRPQIQFATQLPPEMLNQFFERMFPARAAFLKEHWPWLYRVGEFEWSPAPVTVVSGGAVTGLIGTIPVTLCVEGAKLPAVWMVDLAVLPEYQRQGVGVALLQASMERCSIQMGFCNERSLGTALKCGWRLRRHTYSFQLLLKPECHPLVQETSLEPIGRIAGLATRLVWRARAAAHRQLVVAPVTLDHLSEFAARCDYLAVHALRSIEFLQWRIWSHPCAAEHFIFSLPGNQDQGCSAIVRLIETDGYRRLHLLALTGNLHDPGNLSDFFASVVRWAIRESYHRILLVASDPSIAKVARRWFPITSCLRFIYHTSNPALDGVLAEGDHLWECIDSDFDLTQ
ncbi:MAG TPA: GNAT family N-acetyltransferase [Blastocatellia bacterium]|nr:GNAT family N-acetyltransferase [Blastocatellia bacterium]